MPDPDFLLLGDAIWLDFVNTRRGTGEEIPDRLTDPAAYHRWIKAEKLAIDGEHMSFEDVLLFRDRLDALAQALSENRQTPSAPIHALNEILAEGVGAHQLVRVRGRWQVRFTPQRPVAALDAIARSAAATLANPLAVVRECSGEDCTLFLIDTSPNHDRRWCSAATCGRRHRIERRRSGR